MSPSGYKLVAWGERNISTIDDGILTIYDANTMIPLQTFDSPFHGISEAVKQVSWSSDDMLLRILGENRQGDISFVEEVLPRQSTLHRAHHTMTIKLGKFT